MAASQTPKWWASIKASPSMVLVDTYLYVHGVFSVQQRIQERGCLSIDKGAE
jgi:hypothetical protein